MAQSHADIYRRSMEEMMQGRSDTLSGALADDVVWHEAGSSQPLRGKQAVLDRFMAVEGATPRVDIKSSLSDDEHLSVFGHAHFEQGGCPFDPLASAVFAAEGATA